MDATTARDVTRLRALERRLVRLQERMINAGAVTNAEGNDGMMGAFELRRRANEAHGIPELKAEIARLRDRLGPAAARPTLWSRLKARLRR